jgi:amyloid beta precursor protein binding protein 1
MKADTESFVKLQTIYREKARQDVASVQIRVTGLLTSLGLLTDRIGREEIERFCKNFQFIRVIRYTSMEAEYTRKGDFPVLSLFLQINNDRISVETTR